jgi:hypothetical protein
MTVRPMRFAVAAAGAMIVAASVLAGCGQSGPAPSGAGSAAPGPAPPAGPALTPGPGTSLVPRSGVYLGAYVQPTRYSQLGEVEAFRSFEHALGHPLQIVHLYHPWGTTFPSYADRYFVRSGKILLLTWGGSPNTEAIAEGRDDAMIRARAKALKALHRPVMLEFRHEMDRPNLQWTIHGPAAYIAAWDHVRRIFREVGATNVSWVWCPTGYGFQVGRAQAFYPGNNEVDWVCADVYSDKPSQSLSQAAAPFLHWAAQHPKPVIIGEFATGGSARGWAPWLTAAGRLAETDRQIKAMAYFDADGTDSNGNPFQYSLTDRPAALSAFAGLLAKPYFRPAVPHDP